MKVSKQLCELLPELDYFYCDIIMFERLSDVLFGLKGYMSIK